jgi:hypothetical protein
LWSLWLILVLELGYQDFTAFRDVAIHVTWVHLIIFETVEESAVGLSRGVAVHRGAVPQTLVHWTVFDTVEEFVVGHFRGVASKTHYSNLVSNVERSCPKGSRYLPGGPVAFIVQEKEYLFQHARIWLRSDHETGAHPV